jgi:hypothetical protein
VPTEESHTPALSDPQNRKKRLMQISPKSAETPASKMSRAVIASKAACALCRVDNCCRSSPAKSAIKRAMALRQQQYFRLGSAQDSNLCAA